MKLPNLKQNLHIIFVDELGMEEIGQDMGGLFKEFWTQLSKFAFNPDYGLWKLNENFELYPNPSSHLHSGFGKDTLNMFYFLGRVLGKALYEGLVVDP